MNICPNKSSKEWKILVDNLKIYMIELNMYESDYDVEQHGIISYLRFGKGEIPNPVQGMRLIIRHDELKKKRFEEYLKYSKRDDNLRWRIKSLPQKYQNRIRNHLVLLMVAKKRGESKEFMDKLHKYLLVYGK